MPTRRGQWKEERLTLLKRTKSRKMSKEVESRTQEKEPFVLEKRPIYSFHKHPSPSPAPSRGNPGPSMEVLHIILRPISTMHFLLLTIPHKPIMYLQTTKSFLHSFAY